MVLDLRKKHRAINGLEADLILLDPVEPYRFTEWINELIMLFPAIREDYEFSEEELKNLIQKILIEMKDRYP
jgi:hypothetical protein